ncbi:transglycosylase domain-containing protein [Desulforamulus hydrothermalis]|uniref:Penicillin-binding protein 1A n=1 Tax=Desulforamulus hydrothermalis Lam5 = DSM 18033 TaxID=1121428 RepID=K8EE15_9FIRM|nr:penicillin-binding protein 1A [Desulforamulus hydrothermalis]CCO07041.1 Penicillin-binding protein, 1A family [Desulforamulus hydrothermalis Lam5 = DSM 18033]SHG96963.1 penicillin-binding protein, 1A family [Desulforamulus hydrothermalis Lam5 = DSM 18033]
MSRVIGYFLLAGFIILFFSAAGCATVDPEQAPDIAMPSKIVDINNKLITTVAPVNTIPVSLDEIAPAMQQAIVAIEDERFYQHRGLDFKGLLRAAYQNLRSRGIVQGGSTITQQLAKNLYLGPERTLGRKVKELFYTIKLERTYTKKEILNMYLNRIYFGQGAYGVEAAARIYFNKSAKDLTLGESAMLAGLPRAPSYYAPTTNPEGAKERQKLVLNRMRQLGMITEEAKKQALAEHIQPRTKPQVLQQAPYFVAEIIKYFTNKYTNGLEMLYANGLTIQTSLDLDMQKSAEEALEQGLNQINEEINGALVAVDPQNGYIKAMVGGRNWQKSQFNRVLARVQPGSAFKPFLYTAAVASGYTAASTIYCEPVTYQVAGAEPYAPRDHKIGYHYRPFTLKQALAISDNVVAVRLADMLGPDAIVRYARAMGIESPLRPFLSLALGTSEVTPLEMATAFGPLANQGIRCQPVYILKITDSAGRILEEQKPQLAKVIDEKVAYIVTDMLKAAVQPGGTAARIAWLFPRPAAGKTGTTEDYTNAWFVGYTPNLVAAVYVGYDDKQKKVGLTGGDIAAPIWGQFMQAALKDTEVTDFLAPPGVVQAEICTMDGLRATPLSGDTMSAYFIQGTEPKVPCLGDFGWTKPTDAGEGVRDWVENPAGRQPP